MMILLSLVHSPSFSLVQRKTNFHHYESLDNPIFQKLPDIPEITGFMMNSVSVVHPSSISPLRRRTSFLRYE